MNRAPVSTSPPLLAKQVRTVVLNLWVATPRGSDDAFTGVAYNSQKAQIITVMK